MVKVYLHPINWDDAALGTGFIKEFYSEFSRVAIVHEGGDQKTMSEANAVASMFICSGMANIHGMRYFPNLNLIILYDRKVPDRIEIDFSVNPPVLKTNQKTNEKTIKKNT